MSASNDTNFEQMLVDEGLELLAAYRSIADRSTRLATKDIVVAISNAIASPRPNEQTSSIR